MSMEPKRLVAMKRLQALLEGPMIIHDVEYDMAGQVVRGKSVIGEEMGSLPRLAILEAPRPDFAVYAGYEKLMSLDYLTLLIEGTIPNDALNPGDEGYWFHAAVVERLARISRTKSSGTPEFPEHYMLGKAITDLEIAPPVVRPPEDKASAWAFFYLVVRLGMAGNVGNPYTSVV